ncbi:ATP-binding cassette sub-family G member 1 [Schistocerca cancellata]|uniref:ATP-binding cassette sub-family G member 1 n=1 Tax=Schistocerca cancellata TaxID=274614 RepID=UPI002118CE69|nr:ATP-binding cassette sub-family G member 1 [Schistocerca cancellata]
MDVGFRDLKYTVNKWYRFSEPSKTILHGLSGTFKSGRLTAILGPSGAGKSSLLDVLSGCRRSGVSGELLLGGSPRDEAHFRRVSCYLMQEDLLQPRLTVRELMLLAAELKMPARCSRRHREETTEEILETLGLWEHRNTRTERLSGGQRKRLCVALELVSNPPVFFLDEPTSGLDEVSAKLCLRLLHEVSRQGRAVVCTLHTPSASLLALLDDVYAMARGRCVYQGPSGGIVSFLAACGLYCPTHYNPVDYLVEMLEVPDEEDALVLERLCAAIDNGRNRWQLPLPVTAGDEYGSSQVANVFAAAPDICNGRAGSDSYSDSGSSENDQQLVTRSSNKKLRPYGADCPVSTWRQFILLCRRMATQARRNKVAITIQVFHHLMCALLLGLVFFRRANDGSLMFEHLKFCVAVILFHTYTWCMVQAIIFPIEAKLVMKEHLNGWYSLHPYYMALQLISLPSVVFLSLVFLSIIYAMIGLPMELNRFLLFAVMGIITSVAAEGMGIAIGSTFSITNGCIVGPATIAPFLGLAIYGFDFAHDIPAWMNVLMQMSFMRSGVVGLVLSVFGLNRSVLDCPDIYCHYADPKVILQMTDVDEMSFWTPISYIIFLTLTLRILGFIGLRVRLVK